MTSVYFVNLNYSLLFNIAQSVSFTMFRRVHHSKEIDQGMVEKQCVSVSSSSPLLQGRSKYLEDYA